MSFHSLLAGREGALEGGEPGAPEEDYLIIGGEEPGIPGKNTLEIHPTGSPPSAPQGVGMVCLNHAPLIGLPSPPSPASCAKRSTS